jgi:hypothetical protein
MKRKIFVSAITLFILAFFLTTAHAQLKFGVKAGLSSSSITMKDIEAGVENPDYEDLKMTAGEAMVGFHVGVISRIEIASIFLQPELYFNSSGGKVKVKELDSQEEKIKKMKFNKFDLPVLVGKSFGPARVELGPVASFILSSESGLKEATSEIIENSKKEIKENFRNASWGGQIGLGLDIWQLGIDLKYEFSLSKLGENVTIYGKDYTTDTRNNQILVSVAYFF